MSTLYIIGRGRSGSTFLAALLGHDDQMQNVGELIYPMDKECSCGETFSDCEFWTKVRKTFKAQSDLDWQQSRNLLMAQAHISQFFKTLLLRKRSPYAKKLKHVNDTMVCSILRVANKRWLVDASKEPTRALFLMRNDPDAKFVHIVRRPEGVISSYLHRVQRGSINFLRHEYKGGRFNFLFLTLICLSWVVGNLLVEIIRLFGPSRLIRVRYEDLCLEPVDELKRIAALTGENLDVVIDAVVNKQPMPVGHINGGNGRMRSDESFVFDPSVGTSRVLPLAYKLMVRIVSWPLMWLYGYPILRQTDMPVSKQFVSSHTG